MLTGGFVYWIPERKFKLDTSNKLLICRTNVDIFDTNFGNSSQVRFKDNGIPTMYKANCKICSNKIIRDLVIFYWNIFMLFYLIWNSY